MKKIHTMSSRAKRVLHPLLLLFLAVFLSFGTQLLMLGTSAFPGGKRDGERYWTEEHGKIIELTSGQYWLGYGLGLSLVAVTALILILVLVFYCTGDLKDSHRKEISPE